MLRRKEFQKLLGINTMGYEALKKEGRIKSYKVSHRVVYIEVLDPELKILVEKLKKERGYKKEV